VVFSVFFLLVLELLRQRGIFSIGFGTVATAWYFFYWFCNCCDSAVIFVFFSIGFGTVATARYSLYFFLLVLGLLRQRGIFYTFSIGFGTVATAWYFLYFFYRFWDCCDSVVF
jgi:uncharacterized membrane protein